MAEKKPDHQAYLTVYFCGSENCPPRHAYGPAVRPHYLLHVILKGRGIYQYKGQTYGTFRRRCLSHSPGGGDVLSGG